MFTRLRRLWRLGDVPVEPVEPEFEPFVKFACVECGVEVIIEEAIPPGNIGVAECTCGLKWAIHVPVLIIRKLEDQPLVQPFIEEIANEFSKP